MRARKPLIILASLVLLVATTSSTLATPYSGQTGRHSSGVIDCTGQSVVLVAPDVGPAAGSVANVVWMQHYLMWWNGVSWVYVKQDDNYVTSPWYATYIHVALDSEQWREYRQGDWYVGDGSAFMGVGPGFYTFQTWFYWYDSTGSRQLGLAYDYPGTGGADYYCQVPS